MKVSKASLCSVPSWSTLFRAWLGALLCLAAAFPSLAAAEPVQIFLPTDRLNPEKGRYDAMRMEVPETDLSKVPGLIQKFSGVMTKPNTGRSWTVPIYLSHATPEAERVTFVEESKKRMAEALPGDKLTFQIRYLGEAPETPEEKEKKILVALDKTAKALPQDETTQAAVELLKEATRQITAEEAATIRNELPALSDPATARELVKYAAVTKSLSTLGGRGAQIWKQGVPTEVGPFLSSLVLVLGDTALCYYATKYETVIGKMMTEHPLPLPQREGLIQRMQEIYTTSETAQIAKGTMGNIVVWGVTFPALFQAAGHFANPGKVALPSGHDVGMMFLTSAVSSGTYVLGFKGFEKMRQKGWTHQPAVDLILRANGFLWVANSLLLSTGDPHAKAIAPYVLGPMWAVYATPAVLGAVLPAKNDRIILVDPNLKNRADLDQIEALEKTHVVDADSASSIRKAIRKAKAAKPIQSSTVSRWAAAATQSALDLSASCYGAFSKLWKGKPPPKEIQAGL